MLSQTFYDSSPLQKRLKYKILVQARDYESTVN